MGRRQVTLADLARELGISTATVSRALKDYPDISASTKRRVLELAKKLNYRPNSIAASLRKSESHIIGVMVPQIVNHFFSLVIKGIMEVAYEAGYRVMLCQSNESYEKEVADAYALLSSRVDGLLVSIAHETGEYGHFQDFKDSGIPIVFFDKICLEMEDCSKVIVDDYEGAYQAVSHLISVGSRRIAHIGGPKLSYTAMERKRGYEQALRDHGLPIIPELFFACKHVNFQEGYTFGSYLARNKHMADAIFGVTDEVSIGAMMALKDKGISIPDQIAVIGFSDWEMAGVIEPSLSSVHQPGYEMGKEAASVLIREIQAEKDNQDFTYDTIVLKTHLKIRNSSTRQNVRVAE